MHFRILILKFYLLSNAGKGTSSRHSWRLTVIQTWKRQVFTNLVNLSLSSQSIATRVGFTATCTVGNVIGLKSFYMSCKRKLHRRATVGLWCAEDFMRNVYVAIAVVWHLQLDVDCRHFIIMQTNNSYKENSTCSLNDCLKVIKHGRDTGEAVSLQTITKRVFQDESE